MTQMPKISLLDSTKVIPEGLRTLNREETYSRRNEIAEMLGESTIMSLGGVLYGETKELIALSDGWILDGMQIKYSPKTKCPIVAVVEDTNLGETSVKDIAALRSVFLENRLHEVKHKYQMRLEKEQEKVKRLTFFRNKFKKENCKLQSRMKEMVVLRDVPLSVQRMENDALEETRHHAQRIVDAATAELKRRFEEATLCGICVVGEKNALLGCGHRFCVNCVNKMRFCWICKKRKTHVIEIFN